MVVFKEIDSKILPLAVQKYLWDQISTVFQLKTQHASQETLATTGTVCQRLEKMLVHNKVKELQKFFSPELFSEIKSIPRWTFIKGSLSYVIHCVAMILEKRYVLGMTDQLKPFVIKLLYTLHWIVTEAYKECSKPKDEGLDLTDIELFLHMCIPFLSNLNESDLTHSLQSGMHLWQPLWNNIPPRDTLLALPVIKPKDHSTFTSGKEEIPTFYTTATYFDIALVKVMMVDHWTLYGYRWGLQYLQNHFQNILFKLGFDCENCEVIKAINRFTHRKSVLLTMDSQGEMKPADIFSNSDPTAFPPLSETVPESLKMYVDKEGALRTEFLLQLIEKLVKNPNIHQLSGSLLFVHSQIVEISLDDQNIFKMLLKHFSPLLYCQVKIMQLFGCERNCGIGIRGKAENYRYLAHSYLKRIIYADKEKAEEWFINFVATEKVEDSLHLLHALFGICESSPHQQIGKSTLRLLIDDDGQSQQQEKYLENRASNEKNIIEWVTPSLIKFIFLKWKKEKSSNHMEMFTLAHHFIQFVQVKHPMIFRKLIMSGLLDSFTKTTNPPTATSQDSFNASVFSNGSSLNSSSSPSNENTASGGGGGKKWRRGGEILKMMHAKQKTEDVEVSFATLPRNTTQSSQNASSVFSTSLPRNFSMSDDSKSPKGGAQIRTKWGKSTNMHGLLAGVQQLRCLFDLMSPGVLPDELIVGALLDLEAPVVSRASYLMELAYFVNKCNKEDWPMLLELMKSGHIKTSIHELTATKLQAGRLFYKWGIVIGRKLEDMLNEDRMSLEDLSKPVKREKVNFLYQGDIGSVSSYCPQSLRFVACHLLKEITAYLRERHASLIAAQIPSDNDSPMTFHREISHSSSAASSRRPKQSIASALSKKIIEVKRKKSSVNLLVGSASNPDGRDSPSSSPSPNRHIPARKKSTSNVFRSRSPKFGRRYSKQTSRLPLEDQNIDSLLVDSEETSEFPWLSVIIDMNRSINFLCVHSTTQCPEDCPLEQVKSCNTLLHALKLLYEPGRLDDKELDHVDSTHAQKKDVVYEYITKQVGSFYHVPYSVLCKGAFVMDNQQLSDIVAASWEVLLYPDEQLKSAAACLFLVAASKMEATVSTFLTKELTCSGDIDRAKAIQRYEVLWNCRKTVYNHLEETSKTALKVPFPKIEYTVPSRFIGQQPDPEQLPDAPWNPDEQAFNELDVSDDEVSLYFHDSEKQKKIKQERRLKKLKRMREEFPITSVPLNLDASVETWMVEEIADENTPKETNAMACQIATAHQPFFPPAMNVGILRIIPLLDDASITTINSQSVGDLAHSLVWYCLVDDPQTFFRRFFEKITNKNKQEELILLLRKLLFHIPKLPGNAAVILFNNLIGLISFYERTNDKAQRMLYHDKIAEIMPLLWQIVPSVDKLYFNEMKQILRREHIDHTLMVTANVGCVKELIVLGHGNKRENLNIMDEMTFKELLTQMKGAFEIEAGNYWLVDKYSGLLLENNAKIRDVYVFKRGYQCPVLKLEELSDGFVLSKRQQQAKTGKQMSLNQLLLTMSIFDVLPNKKHVMFLHSELYQQASFPRKAIEVDYELCYAPELGKEILDLDIIYKNTWVKFINSLLGHLSTMHHFGEDAIGIFLEPINGALLLHCEDVMILRSSIAALINVAREYGKKFSNDGYFDVLPTIFKVYSQHENNMLVKEVLEFAIAQFYNLHRSPFLLQMFASVSPMLMTDDMIDLTPEELYELIPSRCLFALLESLDHEIEDRLDIMSLVDGEKPIRPYDDVLEDNDHNKIDLSIRLALTIIAYKPESSRALQMMFVLSAIVPYHLKYLESQTEANPHESDHKKHEMRQIKSLIKYIATIIEHNEALVIRYRNDSSMNADNLLDNPSSSGILDRMQSAYTAVRNWWRNAGEMIQEGDEPEHIFEDGENPLLVNATNRDEKKQLDDFYQPRTVLLTLASEFTLQCTQRYSQLKSNTRGQNDTKFSDIIDEENAFILIDVAMSLLQLVFYDHNVLKNAGLQRFLLEAMPSITWTESLEAFTIIIKRMNRIFNKLLLKPAYMSFVDWDGLEVLIKGVNLTVKKDESVADVEDLRSLLHTCTRVMIGDFSTQLDPSAPTSSTADIPDGLRSPSSPGFNTMVIKLAAKLLYIRNDQFGLESNMMMYLQDPDATKVERFLIHWLLPLCIRMGTGRYDMPTLSTDDVTFVSNVLMNLLQLKNADGSTHVANQAFSMLTSFTFNFGRQHQTISPAMSQICFLGLKILLNVFNEAFGKLWKSLRSALIHYIDFNESDYTVWLFISHIVSNRSPVLMHLIPVIRKKLADISRYPFRIQQLCQRIKKDFANPPVMGSRSQVLDHLLVELSSLAKGEVRTLDDNTVKEGEIDETDFKLSNTPVRRVSQEEDDESYIKRVKTERERAWKSGRRDTKKSRVSPKGSIMKRRQTKTSDASPKEKERLRKTVSFKPSKTSLDEDDTDITMEETTQEVPTNFQSSPTRNLSSPRRKIGKLSKRTKHMKMFRRQDSTDCSDDDEKSIIPNDDDRAARSSPPRHLHDDHELSDDSQGKLVKSSSSSTASSENNDDKKDGGGGGRFCEEEIFNESITSPKNGERYTLSVSSSIDSNDGFKERPRCFSHNPSLSRSPAVKRRNERPSLKIAGLATMSTQRLSSLSRDRFSSAKGDERQSIDEGDENSTRQGNSLSPPALSHESALSPALDLSAVTTEFPEERNNTLSPTSIHSSSSGFSSPRSPKRKLSPSLQPFVNFFDDPNGQKPAVTLPEDDTSPSTPLSPPLIERDPLPSVMPLAPVVVPVTLPPTKMKSPPQQKRSLPKPPAFDEESIAKIHKKLSLEMQKPQP